MDITPYVITGGKPSPAMIVCPGGGYYLHADHEGEPVAKWLNEIGISAFVLKYRVAPHQHPAPLEDAQEAIRYVRENAQKYKIDPHRVGILGFSAGGHVAASAGVLYESEDEQAADPLKQCDSRPDLMVLCYPVITMGVYAHEGSRENLLGENPEDSLLERMSLETQVNAKTPPTFLWHTADDDVVPVENSLQFAAALAKYNVPFECHVFETGIHGLGLAEEHDEAKKWPKLCENWFRRRKFIG